MISNVKTGVCKSVEAHPIRRYFDVGLLVTVNSDDPTMFKTTISQEYLVLAQKLGFTMQELKRLSMNGIDASFISDEDKELTRARFEDEWQQLLNKYRITGVDRE